jgi:glycerol-3-phosphate O-acyltransferase
VFKWSRAPIAPSLANLGVAIDETVLRFQRERRLRVERSPEGSGADTIVVDRDQRAALSYYQNTIAVHVIDHAIIAAAALTHQGATVPILQSAAQDLSRMLKNEFSFRADRPFDAVFVQALSELTAEGVLQLEQLDGTTRISGRGERLSQLAGFLEATIGAYVAMLDVLEDLREFPLWEKELSSRGLERVRTWVQDGRLRTPESAQKLLVQNAISWLQDMRVLAAHDGKALRLYAPYDDPNVLERFRARFNRYLLPREDAPTLPAQRGPKSTRQRASDARR